MSFTYSETKEQKNIPPTLNNSSYEDSKDGTINYASIVNKSFEDVHKNWGTSSADVQHINFAGGTGSYGTFNTYDIETRFVFHTIGDCEFYSGSNYLDSGSKSNQKSSDFTDINNFYNHLQIDDGPAGNINYFNLHTAGAVPTMAAHLGTEDRVSVGKRMGKTRFMREVLDFDDREGNDQLILPSNHVTKFSYPFKDRMIVGTQNTDPGQLNVQYEDYSTASFYTVTVTGGENQIRVNSGNPSKGGNDNKIIYR